MMKWLANFMERRSEQIIRFLFPHESDQWLGLLRIGLGLNVIAYCFALRLDWSYLLAGTGHGLISRQLAEITLSLESSFVPRLGWLVDMGQRLGLREQFILSLTWFCLLGAGMLLVIGLFSRFTAIVTWLLHLAAVKSGDLLSYGVDNFTTIGLFYLMLSPLPGRFALDQLLRKRRARNPHVLGFWRRVLQLHLCLIYFFSGISKSLGSGWWNGTNIWRALIRPPFNVIPPEVLLPWKHLFPFLGISVCIIETGYAVFIWGRRTRPICLVSVIAMHLAIGAVMGMYLFALIMIVLNVAAFGNSEPIRSKKGSPVEGAPCSERRLLCSAALPARFASDKSAR